MTRFVSQELTSRKDYRLSSKEYALRVGNPPLKYTSKAGCVSDPLANTISNFVALMRPLRSCRILKPFWLLDPIRRRRNQLCVSLNRYWKRVTVSSLPHFFTMGGTADVADDFLAGEEIMEG